MCRTKVSRLRNQQGFFASGTLTNQAIRLTAPVLALAGWLATIAPGMAVTASYSNDYRACAGRIIAQGEGVTAQAVAEACANSLRPRDLASCVVDIRKNTQINPADALSACSQARRPKDYGSCVVGISKNTQDAVNTAVLTYCNRSLLPVRFAQCVVGLRSQIDIPPAQALDTCIDARDLVSGFSPSSAAPTGNPTEFSPTFETNPIPAAPNSQ